MQIVLFHLMPYADLDLEAGRKHGTVWVKLPNKYFDPVKGNKLYNRYLDELEYAEELGFDAVLLNSFMPIPLLKLEDEITTVAGQCEKSKSHVIDVSSDGAQRL